MPALLEITHGSCAALSRLGSARVIEDVEIVEGAITITARPSTISASCPDRPTVADALNLPWSNGQTEGQITRFKLVRCQMVGRGKLDFLKVRLVGDP